MQNLNGKPYVSGYMRITYAAGKRLKELGVVPPAKPNCGRFHDSFYFPSWEVAELFEYIGGGPRTPSLLRLKGE